MIYLSGAVSAKFDHPAVGFMINPNMGNRVPPSRWWAADNGCFSTDPTRIGFFDYEAWRRWLERELEVHGDYCLFVVVPDVPFNAWQTIARWSDWKDRAAELGRPLAFVTQDGMGVEDVPWADAQAVFIGGSTQWKTAHESGAIATEAKRRGKWVHMGRVNSLRRLQVAASMGCDSVDGTFLKYAPDINWPRLLRWLEEHERNTPMVLETP